MQYLLTKEEYESLSKTREVQAMFQDAMDDFGSKLSNLKCIQRKREQIDPFDPWSMREKKYINEAIDEIYTLVGSIVSDINKGKYNESK